jgi:hypothetical protein
MEKTLFDEFFRQRSDLGEASKTPVCVLFSDAGYARAMKERPISFGHYNDHTMEPWSYCGLPYHIVRGQESLMIVSDKPYDPLAARRTTGPITVHVDGIEHRTDKTTIELVGSKLTSDQLCDVITEWTKHNPSRLAVALSDAVRQHGRFE